MKNNFGRLVYVMVVGLVGTGCAAAEPPDCSGDADCDIEERVGVSEQALVTWTAYASEETAPALCPYTTIATGMSCSGRYCDNVSLLCQYVNNTAGNYTWTDYFSEEGTSYRFCSAGFVTGIECTGSYCDNMRLRCMTVYGAPHSPCYWSGSFSEETPSLIVPDGYAIAGMGCSGSYCDNISLYYCKL